MDTKSAAAAVIGARHARTGKNGQDAAAAWAAGDAGAIVVCDGCSAGAGSEVGARLAAQVALWAVVQGLLHDVAPALVWDGVRGCVIRALEQLVDHLPDRERAVHDQLLFTIVAAARRGDELAVWAVGDGGYAIGDRERVLGPFADNQPPYLGYELLGAEVADHLELAGAAAGAVAVGTDGACELGGGLARFAGRRFVDHPDALRRELARCARPAERIDWDARRVERRPALLQDDGAVAVLRWRP